MVPTLVAIGVLVVLPAVYAVLIYNLLVRARARVGESWSNVDVELQRRHDLIPNLCETVRGYATHERELLERVTELRGEAERLRAGPATREQLAVEGRLEEALGQLLVRVESYPDLAASEAFLGLQGELAHTEDRIASALRYYNGNVRDLNVRCEAVPSNVLAKLFGFEPAEYFKLQMAHAREAPRVSALGDA